MSSELPAGFDERLVADCPDAVIYADAAGYIRYWNAAAARIFGSVRVKPSAHGLI